MGPSSTLKQIYGPIQADIDRVEKLLHDELTSDNPFVDLLLRHSTKFQGKRIRPALVLYSARLCGGITDAHITLSAVVELLHTATLVHDDVLDDASKRRQVKTMNAEWGNEASVLFGDLLFAKAYTLCARLHNREANRILAETVESMCIGELTQIGSKFNFDLDEEAYLRIIRSKTADLFSTACRLGSVGWETDRPTVDALGRYGHAFGMAFQIIDDCLDLTGDEQEVGKSLGTDLAKGKPTLPVIRLLKDLDPAGRAELKTLLASPNGLAMKRDTVLRMLGERDLIAASKRRAQDYLDDAKAGLRGLGARDPQLIEQIISLADFALLRRA